MSFNTDWLMYYVWHGRLHKDTGPVSLKGAYGESLSGFSMFNSDQPYKFKYGGVIPSFELAYETWGELNGDHSNAILLHTGLSATSHARSHEVSLAMFCVQVSEDASCSVTKVRDGGNTSLDQAVLWTLKSSISFAPISLVVAMAAVDPPPSTL